MTELWRVRLMAPDAATAASTAAALDSWCEAVSAFEGGIPGAWQVEGLAKRRPQTVLLETVLTLAWQGRGVPAAAVERVGPQDWVALTEASFPPRRLGRFFVHGSHFQGRPPAGAVPLAIDAATAFGTGEHPSTEGCLHALEALARRRPGRKRVIDMGTGTGILAMAAAKTWRRPVEARDIETEAVRVARRNARVNGVAALVRVGCADGWRDRRLARRRPFDLVLANILARPLALMARDIGRSLAAGGKIVLSGLLPRQEALVLAAYRRQRIRLSCRIRVRGWSTLVLAQAPARPFNVSTPREPS